jgi:hypothetical protein
MPTGYLVVLGVMALYVAYWAGFQVATLKTIRRLRQTMGVVLEGYECPECGSMRPPVGECQSCYVREFAIKGRKS